MSRETEIVRQGCVAFAAGMTKLNGMEISARCDVRANDQNHLVDGLWMTCARLVQHSGYVGNLFFPASLWQLTHAPMS